MGEVNVNNSSQKLLSAMVSNINNILQFLEQPAEIGTFCIFRVDKRDSEDKDILLEVQSRYQLDSHTPAFPACIENWILWPHPKSTLQA